MKNYSIGMLFVLALGCEDAGGSSENAKAPAGGDTGASSDKEADTEPGPGTGGDSTTDNATDDGAGGDSGTAPVVPPVSVGNPIITHIYTADPSAHVWDGKVWLYPSHDQDDATGYASMNGHHVFSSSDLLNWTDHGEIMHTDDISWSRPNRMWAPDAAYKNGTYYYYYPVRDGDNQNVIGVATSDAPEGPFTDVGVPIAGTDEIDPAVFVDDDGKAYLYWGGHQLRYAELNDDMITIADSGVVYVDTAETPGFYEGPWVHKRNGIYYLSYATGTHESIDYCTSDSPTGPWEYQGVLMEADVTGGITNHHSVVEFKGQWYMFYHSVALALSGDEDDIFYSDHRRSVCIDYLYYNDDGTIQTVVQTEEGVLSVN